MEFCLCARETSHSKSSYCEKLLIIQSILVSGMNQRRTRVEIVAPVHNRKAITLQCLQSLSKIKRSGLHVHIIIVDDGSTDGTSEAIREKFRNVEIVKGDGSLWYTAGTNRGIQAALRRNPDFVLAINDDTVFDHSFLTKLVSCAQDNPRSVVGPLLISWDDRRSVFQVGAKWSTWYGGWQHPRSLTLEAIPSLPWEVQIIVGNCVLYPVAAISEVGLMNEKSLPQYGDAEYTPRMRKCGWKLVIEPRARVYCQPNGVPPSLRTLRWNQLLNVLFLDQHNGANLARLFIARWYSAPSKMDAIGAFVVHNLRLLLKSVGLAGKWPEWPDPEIGPQ